METLSPQEFKSRLCESLRKSGITDKLKSQLRSKLVEELRFRTHSFLTQQVPNTQRNDIDTVHETAIDSMIWEYLQWRGCEFSLSVFLPESGISQQKRLSTVAILGILKLQSKQFSKQPSNWPLLVLLFRFLSITLGERKDYGIQTEAEVVDGLTEKLKTVESEYDDKLLLNSNEKKAAVEERMMEFQNECEQRMNAELDRQIARFREYELERTRDEIRNAAQTEFDALKKALEMEHSQRLQRLQETERELSEKYKNRQSELESELFRERQKILGEYEILKTREETARRDLELNMRTVKLEEERIQRKLEEANVKMMEADRIKTSHESRLRDEVQKYQLQFDKEHSHTLLQLKMDLAKIDSERALMREREVQLKATNENMISCKRELENCNQHILELRTELNARQKEIVLLKENNQQLNQALQMISEKTKSTSLALEKEVSLLQNQKIDLERSLQDKQKELNELRASKDIAEGNLLKFKKYSTHWQRESRELVLKLEKMSNQYDSVVCKLDDVTVKNRELERELVSVRVLLHHSQAALANEATKYEKEIIQDHQRFYSEQVKPVAVRQHPIPEIPQDWRYEKSKYALLNEKESQDPFKSSKTFEKAISVEVVPQQTAAMPFDHMPVMLDNLEAELKPIQESSSVQESSPVTNENTELPLNNSPDTIEQATESVITTAEAVKQSDLLVTADADPIINDNVIASLKVEERSEQPMKLDQLDVIENNEELQKYLEIVKRNRVPSQQSSDGELSAAEGSARQSASDVDLYERNTDNGSDEMSASSQKANNDYW